MSHVLVTGARGFVGRALLEELQRRGDQVTAITTREPAPAPQENNKAARWIVCADAFVDLESHWPCDVDCVVHLAARVHEMRQNGEQAAQRYLDINRDATLHVARIAKHHGVKRFVFISSIKALGEVERGRPLLEQDEARPEDAYGRSKLAAELGLRALQDDDFATVVLRFPLVYGPGVKANFAQLARAVRLGVPLPLGRALAPRSLLGLANAVDAICLCTTHMAALSETFHVADAETPSVKELIEQLAKSFGRSLFLINIPLGLLRLLARVTGQTASLTRLIEPFRLDTQHIRATLGWQPPLTLAEGLRAMTQQH